MAPSRLIAPTITSQPASQVVSSGEQASFSVVAQGSDPLNTSGAATACSSQGQPHRPTPHAATESDDGAAFSVVVSNPAGTIESQTAKLTVNTGRGGPEHHPPSPPDQTIIAGQSATFSVAAAGSAPLAYQWQKNGAPIAGATAATYTITAASTADDGASFAVVVTNSAGSTTSRVAKLSVTESAGGAVAPTIAVAARRPERQERADCHVYA